MSRLVRIPIWSCLPPTQVLTEDWLQVHVPMKTGLPATGTLWMRLQNYSSPSRRFSATYRLMYTIDLGESSFDVKNTDPTPN